MTLKPLKYMDEIQLSYDLLNINITSSNSVGQIETLNLAAYGPPGRTLSVQYWNSTAQFVV